MQNLKNKKVLGVPVLAVVAGVFALAGVAYAAWAVFLNTTGSVQTATVTAEYAGMDRIATDSDCQATASGSTLAISNWSGAFPGSTCDITPIVENTGTASLMVQGFQGVPDGITAALPSDCGVVVSGTEPVQMQLTVNDQAAQGATIDLSTIKLHLVLEDDYVAADCPVAAA